MRDKIKWFWSYYRKYRYVLFVLIFLTPVQTAFQVAIPRMMEFTVDFVKNGEVSGNAVAVWLDNIGKQLDLSTVATFTLTLVLLGLVASVLYAYVQGHRAWMNLRLEWLFRQKAFDGITFKGPDFFNRFRTGDLLPRSCPGLPVPVYFGCMKRC